MAEPSRARARRSNQFSRGRLLIGLLLVGAIGAGAAVSFGRIARGPDAGRLVYATSDGVFARELESGDDRRLATLPDDTKTAIPSPDGRWVAYALGDGEVWLAALDHDQRYEVADRLALPLSWSPDGRLLVLELGSDGDLVAVDPGGAPEVLATGRYGSPEAPPLWLDDHRLAIGKGANRFVLIDVEGGLEESDPISGHQLAVSPDGAELLYARSGEVVVASVDGIELAEPRVLLEASATIGAASPQGYLAVAGKDGDGHSGVWIFQGGTDSSKVVDGKVGGLAWTNEGAVLIYERSDVLYAIERPGAEPKRVSRRGVKLLPYASFVVVG